MGIELSTFPGGRLKGSLFLTVYIFSPLGLKPLLYYLVSPPSIKHNLFYFILQHVYEKDSGSPSRSGEKKGADEVISTILVFHFLLLLNCEFFLETNDEVAKSS